MSSIAYLGPQGTHSETVVRQILPQLKSLSTDTHHVKDKSSVKAKSQNLEMIGIPCSSIPDVFKKVVNGDVDAGLVPFENLLHGAVAETFDQLCLYRGKIIIRSSHVAEIRQALGVLPIDDKQEQDWSTRISELRSHPQALGQCAIYLDKMLPHAARISTTSTGSAAAEVSALKLSHVGVIGPIDILKQSGFQIVESDISDTSENKTRFVLIAKPDALENLDKFYKNGGGRAPEKSEPRVTSLMIDPGRDRKGLLIELLEIISNKHHLNLIIINSRPDLRGGFVFHFDLEGSIESLEVAQCLADLDEYCSKVTGSTAALTVFGSYNRTAFTEPLLSVVSIIGANGVMGRWFSELFKKVGIVVREYDVDSKISLKDTVVGSDAVIISVPMSAANTLVDELTPLLTPGQLVVENCSIKSCILPKLTELPSEIEVLGIHTMFSGAGFSGTGSLRAELDKKSGNLEASPSTEQKGNNSWAPLGQNVVVTKTASSRMKAQAFEDLLYKHGATISYSSIEKHDQAVAVIQSVIQLILIATGETLARTFPDTDTLNVFATPNSRSMLQAIRRVVNQPDTLIKDLQTLNPHAERARHILVEIMFGINAALDHNDTSKLISAIEQGKRLFL